MSGLPIGFDRAYGDVFFQMPEQAETTWKLVFQSEMDLITEDLERAGYHIWFTCEVDGIEHRLAARTHETDQRTSEALRAYCSPAD